MIRCRFGLISLLVITLLAFSLSAGAAEDKIIKVRLKNMKTPELNFFVGVASWNTDIITLGASPAENKKKASFLIKDSVEDGDLFASDLYYGNISDSGIPSIVPYPTNIKEKLLASTFKIVNEGGKLYLYVFTITKHGDEVLVNWHKSDSDGASVSLGYIKGFKITGTNITGDNVVPHNGNINVRPDGEGNFTITATWNVTVNGGTGEESYHTQSYTFAVDQEMQASGSTTEYSNSAFGDDTRGQTFPTYDNNEFTNSPTNGNLGLDAGTQTSLMKYSFANKTAPSFKIPDKHFLVLYNNKKKKSRKLEVVTSDQYEIFKAVQILPPQPNDKLLNVFYQQTQYLPDGLRYTSKVYLQPVNTKGRKKGGKINLDLPEWSGNSFLNITADFTRYEETISNLASLGNGKFLFCQGLSTIYTAKSVSGASTSASEINILLLDVATQTVTKIGYCKHSLQNSEIINDLKIAYTGSHIAVYAGIYDTVKYTLRPLWGRKKAKSLADR